MKKTLLKRLTSVTLATALIGTMGVAAFAEDGKADVAANSYLIKYLEVGEGITVPNETFTFTFTQTKYNGADVTDTYKADITAVTMTTNSGTWDKTNDADDEASIYQKKSMADILANTTFPAAGVYTYTVAETEGNTDGFTYDGQTYVLNVYVTNEGKKTIEVKKEGTGDKEGEKVDVTKTDPTKDTEETTGDNSVTVQGFTFDNKYAKTNTKTDDNTEGFLNISKTVAGDYGDKTYGFEFAITLTAPRLAAANAKAKYSIYNTDGTKASSGEMAYGSAQVFALKDGQTLRFYEIEAGTKYSVTEKLASSGVTKAEQYTASVVATNQGSAVTVDPVAKHTDLTVETYVIDDSTDTKDDVDYTNTFDDTSVSPTGILINNAPYIILALVAAGGMTFYVVKKRKEN
jgi:pilin isopeptide linkage protein